MSLRRQKEIKKTTKDHKCWGCGKVIPSGSKCKYAVVSGDTEINNGKFTEGYFCDKCIS